MTEWDRVHRLVVEADDVRAPLYVRGGEALSRDAVRVGASGEVSYATYFGAFPAAYWIEHTSVRRIRATGTVQGNAKLRLVGTDALGAPAVRARFGAAGAFAHELELDPTLAFLWIEADAAPGTILAGLAWEVRHERADVSTTVAITTFDRREDCLRLLERIADSARALEVIDRVVVVDQGTRSLRSAPDFSPDVLGARLDLIEQPNLGGSGGFSRGMLAAVGAGSSHVLVLDDDVDLEPESLRRMVDFAAHAGPRIVGAHMLSLLDPTRLHSYGERIDRRTTWWGPVAPALSNIDLAVHTVDSLPALSERIDVDFNGWWMCLIPAELIAAHGASLPLFIKWDDAEFGLRAARYGVPTVTLPGAALWHMPWTAKDDGLDWQAYFQLRNRLVTALLHGKPRMLRSSFAQDLNHLLCAQYGSVQLRNLAMRDVLSGPEHFDPVLMEGPARANEVLRRQGQVVVSRADAPSSSSDPAAAPPLGPLAALGRLARVLAHQLRAPAAVDYVRMTRAEGKWWSVGLVDRALVETARGDGVFVVRRDRGRAWRLLREAVALRARLRTSWRSASLRYRRDAAYLASAAAWEARFAGAARSEHVD